MTSLEVLLVLTSAILHTTWSLLAKCAPKSTAFYFTAISLGVLLFVPLGLPAILRDHGILHAYPFFIVSGIFLALYYSLMAYAYHHMDLSLAYPLLRISPVFSTVWAVLFLQESVTWSATAGIGAAVLGCVILPMPSLHPKRFVTDLKGRFTRIYWLAILAALFTSVYVIVDKAAMTRFNPAGDLWVSFSYVCLEMLICAAILGMCSVANRLRGFSEVRRAIKPILAIAPMIIAAYVLIIVALAVPGSRAAYIGAFRLISVVITVVAGILILREGFGSVRIAAAIVITIGLLLIGLG